LGQAATTRSGSPVGVPRPPEFGLAGLSWMSANAEANFVTSRPSPCFDELNNHLGHRIYTPQTGRPFGSRREWPQGSWRAAGVHSGSVLLPVLRRERTNLLGELQNLPGQIQ